MKKINFQYDIILVAYLGLEDMDNALKEFNIAYDIDPFNVENCHNNAVVHFHNGELEHALQHWFQILSVTKQHRYPLYCRMLPIFSSV